MLYVNEKKYFFILGVRLEHPIYMNLLFCEPLLRDGWNRFNVKGQDFKLYFIIIFTFYMTTSRRDAVNYQYEQRISWSNSAEYYIITNMDAVTSWTAFSNFAMLDGALRNTSSFAKPQEKKFQGTDQVP